MRITICGIPELAAHGAAGVTHVLSILDPGWPDPEALAAFAPHRRVALRFDDVIANYPRAVAPTPEDVATLLEFGLEVNEAGDAAHLLIHCHAGISRSTSAAALLWAQGEPSRSPTDIFAEIGRRRPRAWPNLLLLEYGEAALGRAGEIVPAAAMQYRRVLAEQPQFAQMMRECGRGREVDLAERSAQR
ncbi:MAG: protein-tyrosine-phosphatase [Alphaproteobacteria bacterium]|nr:protein-tyrosine-phosphatase [Alphaproteobacteria bacterium]